MKRLKKNGVISPLWKKQCQSKAIGVRGFRGEPPNFGRSNVILSFGPLDEFVGVTQDGSVEGLGGVNGEIR